MTSFKCAGCDATYAVDDVKHRTARAIAEREGWRRTRRPVASAPDRPTSACWVCPDCWDELNDE